MKIFYINNRFEAESKYEEKSILNEARWAWDPALKVWFALKHDKLVTLRDLRRTSYQHIDIRLSESAVNELKLRLKDEESKKEKIEASRFDGSGIHFDFPRPDGLEYLPFQMAGINAMKDMDRILLSDEMGLGKTIQSIGIINIHKPDRVLVVCPASLKFNWRNEFKTWLVDEYDMIIVNGEFRMPNSNKFIIIINYEMIQKYYKTLMCFGQFDLIVCDEAHYMKNPKAQRTRLILGGRFKFDDQEKPEKISGISAICKNRMYLTGTPILNRPVELWPIIHNLAPKEFPNYFSYVKRYCKATRDRFGWDVKGASNLDEFQKKLRASVMIRRLKKDVLKELKGKRRQVIELSRPSGIASIIEEEKKLFDLYMAEKDQIKAILDENSDEENLEEEYKNKIYKLREASKIAFSEMARIRKELAIKKIPQALSFIEDILDNEEKIVVFYHHHEVGDAIKAKFGDIVTGFDGRLVDKEERINRVDKFQNDPNIKIFAGSIGAAGVGITLTSAATVIFVELDWTPGKMSQAEDRLDRIGQVNLVLVIHLVFEESLDCKIAKTIISKQEIIEKALDVNVDNTSIGTSVLSDVKNSVQVSLVDKLKDAVNNTTPIPDVVVNLEPEKPEPKQQEDIWDDSVSAKFVLIALQKLAGVCNYALTHDGRGFNKPDANFGHELAKRSRLTKRQVIAAKSMLKKYHGQIDPGDWYLIYDYKEDINNNG